MSAYSFGRAIRVRTLVFVYDLLAAGMAFMTAVFVRLGPESLDYYIWSTVVFVAIASVIGAAIGLNRGVWRYASLADLVAVFKTATATVLVFALASFLINRLNTVPRSSLLLSWLLLILFLSAGRVAYRILRNFRVRRHSEGRANDRNVIVVGASENAESFIKAVFERSDLPYHVVGMIDPRGRRTGLSIRGVRVLGGLEVLDDALDRFRNSDTPIDTIILTRDGMSGADAGFDSISRVAKANGVQLLRLPEISNMETDSTAAQLQPRPIILEDLLPRRPFKISNEPLRGLVQGTTVLVTGAGGSIGSELCRQLTKIEPQRLILVDSSEFLLYSIDTELRGLARDTVVASRLGNVRDRRQMFSLFHEYKPDYVFHAAALKHVPLVEGQPLEGLATNALGTRNVADAAMAVNATAMVMVSTDKAVNPTNVMGASKRMAEMYCQTLDLLGGTRFLTVRFGNVLGSAGSVVPLFEKQIQAGGPVTVTHPSIERYFMTIPEAVQLVVHAMRHGVSASAGERGRIFVLDMGRPVKIVDVARKMIRLAGYEPDQDIRIEFVGLRPGEKLFEELFDKQESLLATDVEGLLSACPRTQFKRSTMSAMLDDLAECIAREETNAALSLLKRMVPEYQAAIVPSCAQDELPLESPKPLLQIVSRK